MTWEISPLFYFCNIIKFKALMKWNFVKMPLSKVRRLGFMWVSRSLESSKVTSPSLRNISVNGGIGWHICKTWFDSNKLTCEKWQILSLCSEQPCKWSFLCKLSEYVCTLNCLSYGYSTAGLNHLFTAMKD